LDNATFVSGKEQEADGTDFRQVLHKRLTTSQQATVFGGARRRRLPANR